MNLRRLFGLPSKQQKALIDADMGLIMKKCAVIAKEEWQDQKNAEESHNSVCPNCHSKKDIVNKIRQVTGTGKYEGSIVFGFGRINGITTIDTVEVNACMKCGNEWKKFKTKYIVDKDILRVALKYLIQISENPNEKRQSWKMEAIAVFNDCYAETIHVLMIDQKKYLPKILTRTILRKQYKSIYE
jgi:DNA-directed RNA polymerase subunit M/transcription elongation factor TFIIS